MIRGKLDKHTIDCLMADFGNLHDALISLRDDIKLAHEGFPEGTHWLDAEDEIDSTITEICDNYDDIDLYEAYYRLMEYDLLK